MSHNVYYDLSSLRTMSHKKVKARIATYSKGSDFFIDGVWNWYKVQTPLVNESHWRSTIKEAEPYENQRQTKQKSLRRK